MRIPLVIATCLAIAPPLLAQTPIAADWEMTQDDTSPYGPNGPPLSLTHRYALVVKAVDVDGNGWKDVVIGGLGDTGYAVRIHYLDSVSGVWSVLAVETLSHADTFACYDLEVGDLNGDSQTDVVVGRRLGNCTPSSGGGLDSVFLNNASGTAGSCFGSASTVPNPACSLAETFTVTLNDVDGDGDLDLLRAGSYGIQYLTNNGSGAFTYVTTYFDQSVLANYRDLEFGDVDGDGDEDLVAARMGGLYTRVWSSTLANGAFNPANPFVLLPNQPNLVWPTPEPIGWEYVGTCAQNGQTGTVAAQGVTFATELVDLDGDSDLDLVTANNQEPCAAYLNNGNGHFGTQNGTSPLAFNDGLAAYVFPSVTPDYIGSSATLDCAFAGVGCSGAISTPPCNATPPGPILSAPPTGCSYEWTLPGSRVNHCTDVAVADANGDGKPDVAFSNRNDLADAFWCFSEEPVLPESFDLLFFNESTTGSLSFSPCVELLGLPNDGTGYGEFAQLNPPSHWRPNDTRPDWLDANFANATTANNSQNRVWWGLRLASVGCPQVGTPSGSTPQIPVRLHFSQDQSDNGQPWVVLGSYTGQYPGWFVGGVEITIAYDALFQFMTDEWTNATTFGQQISGTISNPDGFAISFDFPSGLSSSLAGVTADLYFAVFTFQGGSSFLCSNPVQLPL